MSEQEEYLAIAWNCWMDMLFLGSHSEVVEAHAGSILYYRLAGRHDLAVIANTVGSILVAWGFPHGFMR